MINAPRFLISAAHKSSGKTIVSTGLAAALTARGRKVATLKKGPDYIDPMWLGNAANGPCHNLDFNIMARDEIRAFFAAHAQAADITLIEANKGLYDGVATDGSDSNAALAKLLGLPVILVVDTVGLTRGIAPLLLGYQAFDNDVNIAGVILNKVGNARHESKLRAAVETYTDITVIGAVHRDARLEIGERHLGLTTPSETGRLDAVVKGFADIISASVDLDKLENIAAKAQPIAPAPQKTKPPEPDIRIAIARDQAFGFYYPDDLAAFADAGAKLVAFNTMTDQNLPNVDGLFIGGGFPEMFIPALSGNTSLRTEIRTAIENGLPAYAECGGLMYLCDRLEFGDQHGAMVGAIAANAVMHDRPQGKGYARFTSLENHPWAPAETCNAHEFHYARLEGLVDKQAFTRKIDRGHGIDGAHDGIIVHNTIAGFSHLRTSRTNPWVARFVAFVRAKKSEQD